MTADRSTDPLNDEAVARLVRDVAGEWRMPPVRLDRPGWRERVRSPRARRLASLRAAGTRLGQAAAAGIALTVVAALLGVWLTTPQDAGKPSHNPSRGTSPAPSGPTASPLPKLLVLGDRPAPSRLVVAVDAYFAIVDLDGGSIGNPIGTGRWGSEVRRGPDGRLYCLCLAGDGFSTGGYARVQVLLVRYDDTGHETATTTLEELRGTPDPRDPATLEAPQDVSVFVGHGPDPRYALVGWAVHDHPVWRTGLLVVDVTTGSVAQRIALPDRSDGEGNVRVAAMAPQVVGTTGDGRLVLAQAWYSGPPPPSHGGSPFFGTDAFTVRLQDGSLEGLAPFDEAPGCGATIALAGPRPNAGGTWLACSSPGGERTIVRLVDPAGAVNDVRISASILTYGDPAATSTVSPDGGALYLWDATGLVLTRVDLATGNLSTATAAAAAPSDPLAAIGHWLTPTATAKVLLSSGIVMSPDGTHVYALGVDPSAASTDEVAGSLGVFVFDARSLAQIGHWSPTADFVSLALSADGRYLYAAGSPRSGVAGGGVTSQPASVTVFDTASGEVRLIAGQLGSGMLLFPSTIVR